MASENVTPQLPSKFKEVGVYGKNPGREIRELERNIADELKRMRDFLNEVTSSVFIIGNRPFLAAVPNLMSKDGPLLGGTSVVPVTLLDTSGSAFVATLPPRREGLQCVLKDASNNAASSNVSVQPFETLGNIDGSPSPDVINVNGDRRWYWCDGTDWWKL